MARFAVGLSLVPTVFSLVRICRGRGYWSSVIGVGYGIPTLLIFLVGTGLAQYNPGAGVPLFSAQTGGQYDSVDLANGNVLVTLPVRHKTGKMPFAASLTGNYGAYILSLQSGEIWQTASIVGGDLITFGLSVPALSTSLVYNVSSGLCNSQADTIYSQFAVADASGTAHPLPSSLKIDTLGCDPYPPPTQVTDGSGYTVAFDGYYNLITGIIYSIYDRSGNYTVSQTGTTINGGTGATVTDPDGVSMGVGTPAPTQGQPTVTTYTDTLGTTALTATTPWGDQFPTEYTYNDASDNPQTYVVSYSGYIVLTAFGCSGIQEYNSVTAILLPQSVSVPGGGTYTIAYEQTPGKSSGYTTGRIAKLILPSGGSISYTYSNGNNGINCTSGVVPKLTRTVNDNHGNSGTWTYVNGNSNSPSTCAAGAGPCNYTVTETDPAGNQTVHSFAGEYQTQVVYPGTSSTQKTVTTCYNGNTSNCSAPTGSGVPSLPITETDVYTSLGISPTNRVQTIFDTYGNVTQQKLYDWGASTPTATTTYVYGKSYSSPTACNSYASGKYIYDTPCYVHTANSAGTDLAETKISYNADGKPASISRWTGASENSWLTTSLGYGANTAAAGVLSSITEPNTAVTTFSSFACNGILPQTTTLPTVNVSMSMSATYDCNGGVKLTDVDANNRTTSYNYTANGADPLYRIKSITNRDGGVVSFSYNTGSTFPWTTSTSTNIAAGQPTITTTTTLDGLGRTVSTQSTDPNNSNGRNSATQFNNLGQVIFQWNPYFTNTDQTYGHTGFTYDAMGRITQVTNPDNTYKTYGYNNRATMFKDESGLSAWSQIDGLGRLQYVCYGIASGNQANGDSPAPCSQYLGGTDMSGSGFLMAYSYDALNNLTTAVAYDAAGSGEARLYVYDGLSRLIAERDSEITNIACGGGYYAKCYSYDSQRAGDLWQRTAPLENQGAAGNTVTTTYYHDLLHRLIEIGYNDLTTAPVFYNYDETNLWGQNLQNTIGRLTSSNSLTSEWNDDVIYGYDPMGRVNLYGQCTAIGCQAGTPIRFISTYTYDYIGDITSPWNNIVGNMTMTPTYNSIGQLKELDTNCLAWNGTSCTSSGTLMTGATYNALGQRVFDVLPVGSGRNETWNYDVNRRGTSYSFGSNYNWGLTYNSNSTVSASTDSWNGNWGYWYDTFNRLYCAWQGTPACTVNDTLAMWYSYDEYGNRWGQNMKAGTGFNVSHNFNGNNRITDSNFSYDVAGNMINDSFHTYAYDAEGRLLTVDGGVNNGGETYNYNSRGLRNRIYLGLGSFSPYEALYNLDGSYETAVNVGTSTMVVSNVYDGGRNLAQLAPSVYGTVVLWHLKDWLGTTRLWIYSDGTLMFSQKTLPWGEQTSSSQCLGGSGGDCGLTDLFQNGEDNTLEAPARQYALTLGSWLTPDPAGLAAVDPTNPQSWNRYAYVMNNPVTLTDPTGLGPCSDAQSPAICQMGHYANAYFLNFGNWDSLNVVLAWSREDSPYSLMIVLQRLGGGSAANNQINKTWSKTFPCNKSAQGVMSAVQNDMGQFADNRGTLFSANFPNQPITMGGQYVIQPGLNTHDGGQFPMANLVVSVTSESTNGWTFTTDPSQHFFSGTVSFSSTDAGNGNVTFSVNVNANWVSPFTHYTIGPVVLAGENSTWNNMLGNVQGYCQSPVGQ